jgi:hypothetical protein
MLGLEGQEKFGKHDTDKTSGTKLPIIHNILLEYGELDLSEYFADNVPPYLQSEIESFWERLFAVANAVRSIHRLVLPDKGGAEPGLSWAG